MMSDPDSKLAVSVIIPTYNAENLIHKALDSLSRQTIGQSRLEVLVIDDCSTDKTVQKVRGYKKKINNLRVQSTKHNTGNAIAGRNIGLESAKGEYVFFLDHDDWLGDEALDKLYNSAKQWNSDVIFGKHIFINAPQVKSKIFKVGNIERVDPFVHPFINSIMSPHKLFRRNFLKEHRIIFDPEVIVGEDALFVMKSYVEAKVISVKSDYEYYYRNIRMDNGNLTFRLSVDIYNHFIRSIKVIDYIKSSNLDESTKHQWLKLFVQRYLRPGSGAVKWVLALAPDLYKINLVNRVYFEPLPQVVLDSLSPEYQLLVRVGRLAESPARQAILENIYKPDPTSVSLIGGRVQISTFDGLVYDASMVYYKIVFTLSKLDIKNGNMFVDLKVVTNVLIHDTVRYLLRFEDVDTGIIVESHLKKLKGDNYRAIFDINHLIFLSSGFRARYKAYLCLRGNIIDIGFEIRGRNTGDSIMYQLNKANEKFMFAVRTMRKDLLVFEFLKRRYPALHKLKNLLGG